MWGSGAAVMMRIVLTIVAVEMLKLPYLKLIGAALLLWIGVRLLLPEKGGEGSAEASRNLAAAIRTILIADLVMSLDNVIAWKFNRWEARGKVPAITKQNMDKIKVKY